MTIVCTTVCTIIAEAAMSDAATIAGSIFVLLGAGQQREANR